MRVPHSVGEGADEREDDQQHEQHQNLPPGREYTRMTCIDHREVSHSTCGPRETDIQRFVTRGVSMGI